MKSFSINPEPPTDRPTDRDTIFTRGKDGEWLIVKDLHLTVSGSKPSEASKARKIQTVHRLTKTISMKHQEHVKRGVALKHVKTVGGCFNEKQARHIL